jgi:Putative endonuclease, protein of unknown function (DUF1780)
MAAIETEDRAAVPEGRPRPRLLLAQRMKPQRDRAVVCALLRELCDHPRGCAWHEDDNRVPQASTLADRGDLHNPAVGMDLTVSVSHVTAALAQHAAWYGARCVGLDVVVAVDGHHGVLVPLAQAPEIGVLALQGWRSVSVVCPPYGMVLYATSGAPAFLRRVTGRLLWQWDNRETLFKRGKS